MIDHTPVQADPAARIAQLEQERRVSRAASGYARFYAALAVFSVFMTFIPLDRWTGTHVQPWPDVWGLNRRNESVQLGIALIMAEIVILAVAAIVAPRGRTVPIIVAVLAVPELLILLSRTGMPDDTEFTAAGIAAILGAVVGIAICLIAAVHVPRLARTSSGPDVPRADLT